MDPLDIALFSAGVPAGSRLRGLSVAEVRLPTPAAVVLIVRNQNMFAPSNDAVLLAGDEIVIATPNALRDAVEWRLRAVSRRGALVTWHGEQGEPRPLRDPLDPVPQLRGRWSPLAPLGNAAHAAY